MRFAKKSAPSTKKRNTGMLCLRLLFTRGVIKSKKKRSSTTQRRRTGVVALEGWRRPSARNPNIHNRPAATLNKTLKTRSTWGAESAKRANISRLCTRPKKNCETDKLKQSRTPPNKTNKTRRPPPKPAPKQMHQSHVCDPSVCEPNLTVLDNVLFILLALRKPKRITFHTPTHITSHQSEVKAPKKTNIGPHLADTKRTTATRKVSESALCTYGESRAEPEQRQKQRDEGGKKENKPTRQKKREIKKSGGRTRRTETPHGTVVQRSHVQ